MLIIAKHPIQHPQHPSPIGHHYVQPHPGGSVTNNNRFQLDAHQHLNNQEKCIRIKLSSYIIRICSILAIICFIQFPILCLSKTLPNSHYAPQQCALQLQVIKQKQIAIHIQIQNGVPYINLQQLCEAYPTLSYSTHINKHNMDAKTAYLKSSNTYLKQLIQKLMQVELQRQLGESEQHLEELATYHQQMDLKIILDTGSQQLWLADTSCTKCNTPHSYFNSKSLCPQLSTSSPNNPITKINYVKGYIQGVYSYINICGSRVRFLCVKDINGLGVMSGNGIFGLREGSVGVQVLTNIVKNNKKQKNIITINKEEGESKQGNMNAIRTKRQKNQRLAGEDKKGSGKMGYRTIDKYELLFNYNVLINQFVISHSKVIQHCIDENSQQYQQGNNIKSGQQQQQKDLRDTQEKKKTDKIKIITGKHWEFDIQQIQLFNGQITINAQSLRDYYNTKTTHDSHINEAGTRQYKQQSINQRTQENYKIKGHIDTGSTKLVIPSSICIDIINKMQLSLGYKCIYMQGQGIDCNHIVIDLNLKLKVASIKTKQDTNNQSKSQKSIYLQIFDKYLINEATNRINILCSQAPTQPSAPSSQNNGIESLILGYPFLQSQLTTFVIQESRGQSSSQGTLSGTVSQSKQVQTYIELESYPSNNVRQQQNTIKMVLISYLLMVGVGGWCAINAIDFIRDKRDKKIII